LRRSDGKLPLHLWSSVDALPRNVLFEKRMNDVINILLALAFIGGVVAVVALWTQRDINRAKEKDSSAKKSNDERNL
jgi:hypothetical protein